MKTIMTSLPIYDKIEKQWFERGKKGGVDKPVPVLSPRHRLPSFQWLDDGDGCNHVDKIELIERDLSSTNITTYFVALPSSHAITGDKYFSYDGDTLNYLIETGTYYLKITMDNNKIYYSDWFRTECIYENLLTSLLNVSYDTFDIDGISLTSVINTGGDDNGSSNLFTVTSGETIKIMFNLTLNSGQLPTIYIANSGWVLFSQVDAVAGLNELTLVPTFSGDARIRIRNTAASNFSTGEIHVYRESISNYLIINFSNTCDIGDILYHDGFTQTLWLESEPMETTFPIDDKGVEDGEGRFIRTFARQVKKYSIKTKELPGFMVDVFHRMRLHDDIELTDLVGDDNEVYNLEVEHEWLWDDKYYAQISLTFDYNEVFIVAGCCNNII
jgi:hypothetical protein